MDTQVHIKNFKDANINSGLRVAVRTKRTIDWVFVLITDEEGRTKFAQVVVE